MKILVTGANGLLGQHLVNYLLGATSHQVVATGRGASGVSISPTASYAYYPLDITDGVAVTAMMDEVKPALVIHTAARTQVDECEQDWIGSWNINVTATRFLISAANSVGARFIYLSTDFVFDGINGPYAETAIPGPINYYGSTKLAAEKAVEEYALNWCIIRTVLVYGNKLPGNRNNIVTWVKENLEAGKKIQVVSDQFRTPTYVDDLVKGILLAVDQNASGLFHISGEEMLSPYEMALITAEEYKLDKNLIQQVDSSRFSQPAKRPAKTGFIIDKAKQVLGFKPMPFKEGLQRMRKAAM